MSPNWIILLIGIALGAIPAWVFQGSRLDAQVAKYDLFVAQVKSAGELAEAEFKRIKTEHKQLKEKSDAENKLTIDTLRADIKRLRNASSGGGGLSSPTPTAESPDRTCFDPTKLSAALRVLDEGFLGIVETGSEAVINLDTAKAWAQQVGANR